MKFILILCMFLAGCVTTGVKYELKESASLKDDPKGATWATDVTFTESW